MWKSQEIGFRFSVLGFRVPKRDWEKIGSNMRDSGVLCCVRQVQRFVTKTRESAVRGLTPYIPL